MDVEVSAFGLWDPMYPQYSQGVFALAIKLKQEAYYALLGLGKKIEKP